MTTSRLRRAARDVGRTGHGCGGSHHQLCVIMRPPYAWPRVAVPLGGVALARLAVPGGPKAPRLLLPVAAIAVTALCAAMGTSVRSLPPQATTVPSFFKATV